MGLTAAWLIGMGSIFFWISQYTARPGDTGEPPVRWPVESALRPATNQPTLLVFIHPHCPCSRATLRELDLLIAQCEGAVRTIVIFSKPDGTAADWGDTDLWRTAGQMRGATSFLDSGETESRRFQAETSGLALLYNERLELVFNGGITFARGHSGDNPGRTAVVDLVRHTISRGVKTPVFGCQLFDQECRKP